MQRLYIVFLVIVIFSITTILIIYSEKKYKDSLLDKGIKLLNSIPKDFKIEDEKFLSIPKYYLNLYRSKDRREKMETQFGKYNFKNWERVEAYDKKDIKDIKLGELNGLKYINEYSRIKDFELAITIGHLKMIKKSYDKGENLALILEDDIDFSLYPKWKKSFSEILQSIPPDMEIFQMSSGGNFRKDHIYNFDIFTRERNRSCAASYLISRKGMEKIVNNFFKSNNEVRFEEKLGLDNIIMDLGIFNYMKTYYINCNLFLLYNFQKINTYNKRSLQCFIEKDYETLKYLTDSK